MIPLILLILHYDFDMKLLLTMIRLAKFACLLFSIAGCNNSKSSRSLSVPDNVMKDKPILIKEGQAVILVPESNKSIMVGASVIDGKLTISEIDPEGKSFSVTWDDEDSWSTTVVDCTEHQTTTVIDKNGDGIPDFRVVAKEGALLRFYLDNPSWVDLKSLPVPATE